MSKLYRKKPVVIEAVQWTGENVLEVYSFMHGAPTMKHDIARDKWADFETIHVGKDWHIKTLEDGPNGEAKHVASVGDWIIKGVQGEFYPCKPDIFAATYEPADTPSPQPNLRVDFNKLYSHPLAQGFYDLAQQIERLGTSPEMTEVIVAVQSVKSQVEAEINRLLQNAASDGALLTRYHRWCEKNGCAPSTSDLYGDGPTPAPQPRPTEGQS